MIKIVIDTLGADKGFEEIVKGAVDALSIKSDFQLILTGDGDAIKSELDKYGFDKTRI